MTMVLLLLLPFATAVQDWVLNCIVPVIEKWAKKICAMVYIHKIRSYNTRLNIRFIVTVCTYFWTYWNLWFICVCLYGLGSIPCKTCIDIKYTNFHTFKIKLSFFPKWRFTNINKFHFLVKFRYYNSIFLQCLLRYFCIS